MIKYQHTQTGSLMLVILPAIIVLYMIILIQTEFNPAVLALMALIILAISSFASLKVIIDETYLQIKFGYGIFKKKFALSEIASAKAVKNHWYYGWGIKFWLWPKMWIFSVSGLDAVEIVMKNGKIYRIGTNEPQALEAAINKEISIMEVQHQ